MGFDGMTIFVTGGAGFIGSTVVRYLLDHTGALVVNIDKLTYAANFSSIPQAPDHELYAFARDDLCNALQLRALFDRYQPHAVMNLAAESHVDRSIWPRDVHPDQYRWHLHVAAGGFALLVHAKRKTTRSLPRVAYFDGRGLRVLGSGRTLHQEYSVQPELALLGQQSRVRPPRPSLAETYRLPTIVPTITGRFISPRN